MGTHVLNVKNVGTVELIVQSAQTSAGHIVRWPRDPVELNLKNVGAV